MQVHLAQQAGDLFAPELHPTGSFGAGLPVRFVRWLNRATLTGLYPLQR